MIRYRCPACGVLLESPDHVAGQTRPCPKCGRSLVLPVLPSLPLPAPLVSHVPDAPPAHPPAQISPATMPPTAVAVPAPAATNRIAVGVLAIAFGFLGAHEFALGRVLRGVLTLLFMLLVTAIASTLGFLAVWAVAVYEGVCFLLMTDQQFLAYCRRAKW